MICRQRKNVYLSEDYEESIYEMEN
jgi:ABC-type multidrug transport system ATPase subunit